MSDIVPLRPTPLRPTYAPAARIGAALPPKQTPPQLGLRAGEEVLHHDDVVVVIADCGPRGVLVRAKDAARWVPGGELIADEPKGA